MDISGTFFRLTILSRVCHDKNRSLMEYFVVFKPQSIQLCGFFYDFASFNFKHLKGGKSA
jgi:hypothetical protein